MTFRRTVTGFVAAAAIAELARRKSALTLDGALAATLVGTCVYAVHGLRGTALMLGFFIPSTLLSRYGKDAKAEALENLGKIGPRDARQVFANGGPAALTTLLGNSRAAATVFAATLAVAAADTWATEVGSAASTPPRSILTGKPLRTGESGGVTLVGSLAETAGALWIASLSRMTGLGDARAVAIGGFLGATIDSLLGAAFQARSRCLACGTDCETDIHRCGARTEHVSGMVWLDNDGVNLASVTGGGLLAYLFMSAPRAQAEG